MKHSKILLGLWMLVMSAAGAQAAEPWKVAVPQADWGVGAMTGLGITAVGAGWGTTVAASRRIVSQTAIRDISNDLHFEFQFGPVLVFGAPIGSVWSFTSSFLGRWDFHYDEKWTFSALGGLGWSVSSLAGLAQWNFFPRFGVAAFYHLSPVFAFRGEISHEQTLVGGTFFF